jgi:predicted TIM-barrel fold metal-dependent hydrolase
MDQWGIEMQVLSLAPPSVYFEDVPMVQELCRVCNDRYGEICSRRPERFRLFASLPIVDMESACVELERAKTLPGFSGIALGSNVLGTPLDDPGFSNLIWRTSWKWRFSCIRFGARCRKPGMPSVSII